MAPRVKLSLPLSSPYRSASFALGVALLVALAGPGQSLAAKSEAPTSGPEFNALTKLIRESESDREQLEQMLAQYLEALEQSESSPAQESTASPTAALSAPQTASATSAGAEINYKYDELNRLVRVEDSDGLAIITYDYDDAGNWEQVIFVPEPHSVISLVAGLLLLSAYSRRRRGSRRQPTKLGSSGSVLLLALGVMGSSATASVEPTITEVVVEGPSIIVEGQGGSAAGGESVAAGPPAASTVLLSTSTELTPEIEELARGLKHDVDLIFEYVYSQIEYTTIWGSNKGAMGALLDKRGNDFDQASLMITLLRASGYTASFEYGRITMDAEGITSWLDIPNDIYVAIDLLGYSGGRSNTSYVVASAGDTAIKNIHVERVWVKVEINGTDYVFDPSFKTYLDGDGIDLAAAMGYSQPGLMDGALLGATRTSDYIQNVNSANLEASLTNYASSLAADLRSNHPGETIEQVLGTRRVAPLIGIRRDTELPALSGTIPVEGWVDIPDQYRTYLRLRHRGMDDVFYTDALSGKRLTVFYQSGVPYLRLEGGTPIDTGTTASPGSAADLKLDVTHPYGFFPSKRVVTEGGSYLILNGWSGTRRGTVDHHQRRHRVAIDAGGAIESEAVLGESLAVLASSWLAEVSIANAITERLSDTLVTEHHQIGVAGQTESPYVDMQTRVANTNKYLDQEQKRAAFFTAGGNNSVFEGGVIRQLQIGGAVSAVELLGVANDLSVKIYDVTAPNANNVPLFGYGDELGAVNDLLGQGFRLILPQDGSLNVEEWSGVGYVGIGAGGDTLTFKISGGYNGGFGTSTGLGAINPIKLAPILALDHPKSLDPIDLVTGDFLLDETDLTIGSRAYPHGLAFQRSYNSASRYEDGTLGRGWTHNFDQTATLSSDGFQGLGEDSPVDAVAAIVAQFVTLDLYSNSSLPLANMVVAALTQRWAMEQLIDNAVTIKEPGRTSVFVDLVHGDDDYNAPPGSADTLSLENDDSYLLTTKHGVEIDFNAEGKLFRWEDPTSNEVQLVYDGEKLKTVTDAAGHTLTLNYTGDRISSVSDGARTFGYGYDSDGNLTSVTNTLEHATIFEYQEPGLLSKIFTPAQPEDPKVSNSYSELGRVETQLNASGYLYTYYYAGSRTEEVDPLLNAKIWYYDDRDRIQREIDALDFETTFEYDAENRRTVQTLPEGNRIEWEYDAYHNVERTTQYPKPGSSLDPILREFTYEPPYNRVKTSTDPRGYVTTFWYDVYGNPRRVVLPAAGNQEPEFNFTYGSRGLLKTVTDPEETVTAYVYDPITRDLLWTTEDVDGFAVVNSQTYNTAGDIITATDPLLNVSMFEYDDMRRLLQFTEPAPFSHGTLNYRNEDGNIKFFARSGGESSVQSTNTTFWPSGKIRWVVDPDLYGTHFDYDAREQVSKITDGGGPHVTEFRYDEIGRTWQEINDVGVTEREYTYTDNGKVASLKDANGNVTGYRYDGFDRLEYTDFPDTSTEKLSYDAASNVKTILTRAGDTIGYVYDELGRLESKNVTGATTVAYVYTYYLTGRLKDVTVGSETTAYTYDTLGRQSSVTHPDEKTIGYEYHASGNRKKLTYPDAYFVTYEYDELNRLDQVLGLGTTVLADYEYDGFSRRKAVAYGNGTSTAYTYQIDNDLESLTHQFTGASVAFGYEYDNVHNREKTTYSDPLFMFDVVASLTQDYSPNNLNQYSEVSGTVLDYDANGNLEWDGVNAYAYDVESRLSSATTPTHTAIYTYGPSGARTSKTVDGSVTRYILDGLQVIAEYDGSNQLTRRYVYGPGIDEPIQMRTQTAATYYYHSDALGSVVALSDSSGTLAESYAYSPFGIVDDAGVLGNPYLYTGREHDPETGLYYYRNRYYDSGLGRFLQPDPIGYQGGMNLYAYVGGNPTNFVDPLGLLGKPKSQSWGGLFDGLSFKADLFTPAIGVGVQLGFTDEGRFVAVGRVGKGAQAGISLVETSLPSNIDARISNRFVAVGGFAEAGATLRAGPVSIGVNLLSAQGGLAIPSIDPSSPGRSSGAVPFFDLQGPGHFGVTRGGFNIGVSAGGELIFVGPD